MPKAKKAEAKKEVVAENPEPNPLTSDNVEVDSDDMPSEEEMEQIVLEENAAEKAEQATEEPAAEPVVKEPEIPDYYEQFIEEPDGEPSEPPPEVEKPAVEQIDEAEQKRREWQRSVEEQKLEIENLKAEINTLKDQSKPEPPPEPPPKTIQDFMPAGQEYDPYEAKDPSTPSYTAYDAYEQYRADQRVDKAFHERQRQDEERARKAEESRFLNELTGDTLKQKMGEDEHAAMVSFLQGTKPDGTLMSPAELAAIWTTRAEAAKKMQRDVLARKQANGQRMQSVAASPSAPWKEDLSDDDKEYINWMNAMMPE